MKIITKAIMREDQIRARTKLDVEGIEVYLKRPDLDRPEISDLLKLCSDNFGVVNLETGDRVNDEDTPTDLLDFNSREYIESVLSMRSKIPNAGLLVVHLAGNCQVLDSPYDALYRTQRKLETLEASLNYIRKLDPENKIIALENTFPTDWMNEDTGKISFYTFGKIMSDFGDRIRTFDPGHSGITMYTLANVKEVNDGYGTFYSEKFGSIPVYFGEEEARIAELAKISLTDAVRKEVDTYKTLIANVHVNGSKGLLDGFGFSEGSDFEIFKVLEPLRGSNANLVTETKERPTGDFLNSPNQKDAIRILKEYFF